MSMNAILRRATDKLANKTVAKPSVIKKTTEKVLKRSRHHDSEDDDSEKSDSSDEDQKPVRKVQKKKKKDRDVHKSPSREVSSVDDKDDDSNQDHLNNNSAVDGDAEMLDADEEEEEEEEEEDDDMNDVMDHAFSAARANNHSIGSIQLTLSRTTIARKQPRTIVTKTIFASLYELCENEDRIRMKRHNLGRALTDVEFTKAEKTGDMNMFKADFDYVGRLHPLSVIGFDLDVVMEALYGPIRATSDRERIRKGELKPNNAALFSDAEVANVSVCYFKRLSRLLAYTGLDVNRVAPIARGGHISSAVQMAGMDDADLGTAKILAHHDRRFLRQNDRIIPIHILPLFLANQSNNVRGVNTPDFIGSELMRQMEARLLGNTDLTIFVNTLRQMRANMFYLMEDTNHRAISGENLTNKLYAVDSKYMQLRQRIESLDPIINSLCEVVSVSKPDMTNLLDDAYLDRLTTQITTAKRQMPKALLDYAFHSLRTVGQRNRKLNEKLLSNIVKGLDEKFDQEDFERAREEAKKLAETAALKVAAAKGHTNKLVFSVPPPRTLVPLAAHKRITLEDSDDDEAVSDKLEKNEPEPAKEEKHKWATAATKLNVMPIPKPSPKLSTEPIVVTPDAVMPLPKQPVLRPIPNHLKITLDDSDSEQ